MKGLKINYDKTFATKYSRDYYRGTSFHYSGQWAAGVHYVADSYNTDFCATHQVLLVCKLSHTSDEYNDPVKHFIYDEDQNIIGIKSKYWDIVIAGINIIGETKEWVDERIDGVIEAYKADIEFSARELRTEFTHDIDDAVNGVTRNYRSEISQTAEEIRSTVEAVETSLDGKMEENYSELKQRADSISATVAQNKSDIEGNLEQKYSELKMTADEIATTVSDVKTDLEGNINNKFSEISQRADQISARVEEVNSNLNGDLEEKYSELKMTANEITSTVAANKTELDNTIQENYSQLSQRADSITATVAQNKSDLEGNIESKFSEVSQKADEIAARVEEVSQQSTGELEKKYSELIMTTDAISATVAANKTVTDGSISDLSSNITQTATEIRSEVNQKITDVDGKVEEAKSSISQTAEQIMATVEANKTELDGTISANYSELKQTAEEIRSEVNAHVETLEGEISDTNSSITQTAAQIRSDVTQQITNTETNITNAYTSAIDQKADSITSSVKETTDALGGRISSAESTITQHADQIASKVSQDAYNADKNTINSRFSAIEQDTSGIHQSVTAIDGKIDETAEELASTLAGAVNDLQNQIDGAVETYHGNAEPTLQNYPASDWSSSDYEKHVGDMYYDKTTGYAYRFTEENDNYYWDIIRDSGITEAIAKANDKGKIFIDTPYTPYKVGDLWVQGHKTGNDGTIYRCLTTRETGNYSAADWGPACDFETMKVSRANLDILSNAIIGQVTAIQYNSDGTIKEESRSAIQQTAGNIRLSVANGAIDTAVAADGTIANKMLGTGIDITNKKIEMTADNIILKNNSGTRALSIVNGSDGKPVIDASNLNVSGIFSTSAWNTTKNNVLDTAQGYANTAQQNAIDTASTDATNKANTAETNAKNYANSSDYLNTKIVPQVTAGTTALKNQLEGEGGSIKAAQDTASSASIAAGNAQSTANSAIASIREVDYLKNALLEENTTVAGGLILSTLIQLGSGAKTNNWQVYSGLNGSYQGPTSIAFWAGGDMTETGNRAAKAVIRMDGSGYFANKNISWDTSGNASFNGDVVAKSFTIGTSDWNDVKSGILNDAASDATTKANAAENNAKSDTTTKITSLKDNEIKAAKDAADAADNKAANAQSMADAAYTLANSKANPGDITDAKDVIAQNLGYTDYSDMAAKAASGKTIINGGYLRTELIETSAITIGSGQVTGLGALATKNSISATSSDITGLGSLATKDTVSAINGDVTGLAGVATSGNYNDLSNKPDIPDISGLADKDDFAQKLGYTDYNAMVAAAQAGNTIISGGYIKTGLIDTDALVVKHLSGADGTFTGTLSAATGSFSGSITANSGNIGGWTIQPNYLDLYDPDDDFHRLRMGYWYDGPEDKWYVFAAGKDWADSDEFNFAIDDEGHMYASGANISGRIVSSEGQIGGFTIGTSKLYNGLSTLNGTSEGVYLGTDGIALGGGKFKVTKDGTLTATSGQIAGFTITREGLEGQVQSGNNSTLEFELSRLGLVLENYTAQSNYPDYFFSAGNVNYYSSASVCAIGVNKTGLSALTIDLGQSYGSGISIYDAGRGMLTLDAHRMYFGLSAHPSLQFLDSTSTGNSYAIECNTGMFAGLRPKTRYITSSTSSDDKYLDSLDYTVIVNNASSLTLYLPSSPKAGQTYYIMHTTATALSIHSNSTNIFSMSANVTEQDTSFAARGTLLIVWNASQSKWICDILSSY